jgi:glutamate dehydrogenase (NADP+)
VKDIKEVRRGRISEYAKVNSRCRYVTGGSIWDVPCDVALP